MWADKSNNKINDSKECQSLIVKHALAVDAAKEGTMIYIPSELRPTSYPDFMNKTNKPTYKSDNVFGWVFQKFDSSEILKSCNFNNSLGAVKNEKNENDNNTKSESPENISKIENPENIPKTEKAESPQSQQNKSISNLKSEPPVPPLES